MILNDTHDSFYLRVAAASLVFVSFVEGRQITQEDDLFVASTTGLMSLAALGTSIANIYHYAKMVGLYPGINKSNMKKVFVILGLSCALIRITFLRAQFLNPTEYLDRHHPLVWEYISLCGSTLTLCAYLE